MSVAEGDHGNIAHGARLAAGRLVILQHLVHAMRPRLLPGEFSHVP
jgi:hypothetical protein